MRRYMANSLETATILLNETLAIREKLIQTAEQLLKDTSVKHKNCEKRYREEGTAYNIFKAAGISKKEVPMCNVLLDLLKPEGLHYRKSVYLGHFMDMVVIPYIKKAVGLDLSKKFDLSKAKVKKQSSTDESRLIDIEISDGKVFIFIEAKINAREQPKQLSDYADHSEKTNKAVGFIPVLFLTPNGRDSDEGTPKNRYVPISFERDIVSWLDACLELEETKKAPPVREVLQQFINAIKSFCGNMEDEEMEAINDLIMVSKDSYTAALMIHDAVNKLDFDGKVREIFKEQILSLVREKLPDAEYVVDGEGSDAWYCLIIPVGNGCKLCVNYDMQCLTVESQQVEAAEKIGKIMYSATGGAHNQNEGWGKGVIWANTDASVKCPGIKDTDNDSIYKYDLYQICSKDPQSVANWIVSIANALGGI